MEDQYRPIKGKCMWWRESRVEEDVWDVRLKDPQRRVSASCFVEGKVWVRERRDVPENCPDNTHCRYYIKHM
jgi:hypothetical protein